MIQAQFFIGNFMQVIWSHLRSPVGRSLQITHDSKELETWAWSHCVRFVTKNTSADMQMTHSPFFFKLRPHSKIKFENNTSFTRRITWKTDEIGLAQLTING